MFAHTDGGHWIIEALYVLPVLLVVGFISVRAILDRRAEAAEGAGEATPEPEPPPAGDPPA
jgi:uncharacterized membrane protein